ncbi:hypothetical protein C4B68_01700 [Streptomyces dengpaensis]|uniref:Uncharacterized protein n=1 Tax=Streptomyces dengpaensis TaxID=2049881 RepID=A0ABM6SJA1_9ACTN|nr:hypothetical protein C4B68_01700 [Streptomyces dengpaensis]PIB03855.1 hypothetical protein B1C81_35730 [Streptomyces sp. HG99]
MYSIDFSNPKESDNNDLPEPYGRVCLQAPWGQQTALWEHPDVDINTPTLPRYPDAAPYEMRFVDHPVTEVCAFVGEDDTGINDDDVLAAWLRAGRGPWQLHHLHRRGVSYRQPVRHLTNHRAHHLLPPPWPRRPRRGLLRPNA